MADKVPIRAAYSGANALTGLATFASAETIGVAHGGTGAASLTDDGILLGNATGAIQVTSALTTNGQVVVGGTSGPAVANISGTTNEVEITNGDGTITVGLPSTISGLTTVSASNVISSSLTGTLTTAAQPNITSVGTLSTLLVSGSASATSVVVADSGAALASQDAYKIILVDLNDPATMWDVQKFLARARFTSWYQELGAPPMRGTIFIDNAKTSLIWWNLDTDASYMSFTPASANIMRTGSVGSDVVFLDGFIYVADAGGSSGRQANIIDLMSDRAWSYSTGGQNLFDKDLENRNNGGSGYVGLRTSPVVLSNTVNGVAAVRDPSLVDEFDRPKHWLAIATDVGTGGASGNVYNPLNDAIYTSTMGEDLDAIAMSQSGKMWWMRDNINDAVYGYNIYSVNSNGVGAPNYLNQADWNGGTIGNSGSSVIVGIAAFDAPNGFDGLAVATNAGLDLGFMTGTTAGNQNTDSAHIFITSTYQTPYMKGARGGAYPLNDLNDRSGPGLNLTNTGSTPQATGPFGTNTAYDFDGSSQMLEVASNAAQVGTNKLTVSCWFNPDAASGEEALVAKYDSTSSTDNWMLTVFGADMRFYVNSSNTAYIASGVNLATGQWYHAAGVYDGEYVRLYLNGVEATTKAALAGNMDTHTVKMTIGAEADNNHNFNGKISQVSIQMAAWSEAEVKLEYQRMIRALGGATGTLANSDVKSVRVDQNTGLAAVTTAANQTEIWDLEMGLRQSIDATTTATIADADVRLKTGAILPEYITGRSGAIEFDGQERNVIG